MRYLSTIIVLGMMLVVMTACNGGKETTPVSPTFPTGKPTGVHVEAGDKSVTIGWNPVSGAVGYYVYKSTDGNQFERVTSGLVEGVSATIFDLLNYSTYYFGVSAVGSGGWETSIAYPGGAPTATPIVPEPYVGPPPGWEENPPPAPANLQGVAKDGATEIEWDPIYLSDVPDFAFYRIYRLSQIADFSTWAIIEDSWDNVTYRNEDLQNDSDYSYKVTSLDTTSLESKPSNVVTLHPMDFPPEVLKNVNIFVNFGRIVLEWDNPAEADIAKFALERWDGINILGGEVIVRVVIDKPTSIDPNNPETDESGLIQYFYDVARNRIVVTDTAIIAGTMYTYRLSAIDTHTPDPQEGPTFTIVAPSPAL